MAARTARRTGALDSTWLRLLPLFFVSIAFAFAGATPPPASAASVTSDNVTLFVFRWFSGGHSGGCALEEAASIAAVPALDKVCSPRFGLRSIRVNCSSTTAVVASFDDDDTCTTATQTYSAMCFSGIGIACASFNASNMVTGYLYADSACTTARTPFGYVATELGRCTFILGVTGVESAILRSLEPGSAPAAPRYNVSTFSDWSCAQPSGSFIAQGAPGDCVPLGESGSFARLFPGVEPGYVTSSPTRRPTAPTQSPSQGNATAPSGARAPSVRAALALQLLVWVGVVLHGAA